MDFNSSFPNNEAYLQDYEVKIRNLPLGDLYEILDQIESHPLYKDTTPERINIVKKRIRELEPNALLEKAEKEAFHAKIVEESNNNSDPRIALFVTFSIILFIITVAIATTEHHNQFICLFTLGGCIISYTISCIFKKVIYTRGGRVYKDENEQAFKILVGIQFLFGAFCIIAGILNLCEIFL